MHEEGLAHRNLKPRNIICMLKAPHKWTLVNFGNAARIGVPPPTPLRLQACGCKLVYVWSLQVQHDTGGRTSFNRHGVARARDVAVEVAPLISAWHTFVKHDICQIVRCILSRPPARGSTPM